MSKDITGIRLEKGRRYLFKSIPWSYHSEYYDAIVLEISPSSERVKLEFNSGTCIWYDIDNLFIVEGL